MKPFDSFQIPLEGTNLIEASAGTGKTHSIALLALRFIVEKNYPVQNLLMVTFTKAAVAELEARVRHFVRLAYRYANGQTIHEDAIKAIVDRGIKQHGAQVKEQLHRATLFLDETAILTIHGFCQLVLKEFAFETDQLFGAEIAEQEGELQNYLVDEFWRKEISVIPVEALGFLFANGLSRERLFELLQVQLAGKDFKPVSEFESGLQFDQLTISWNDHLQMQDFAIQGRDQLQAIIDHAVAHLDANYDDFQETLRTNRYAKDSDLIYFSDAAQHVHFYFNLDEPKGYHEKVYEPISAFKLRYQQVNQTYSSTWQALAQQIYIAALQDIQHYLQFQKAKRNIITFDDIIFQLHKAITGSRQELLRQSLQKKYWAVFIDEFQDTDKMQYEIFSTAFNASSTVFYIGDPKQSIYGWRKADIDTYFEASAAVANTYTMEVNYRSAANYIEALNHFFLPKPEFDTFQTNVFGYANVKAAKNNLHKQLLHNNVAEPPISIIEAPNVPAIATATAKEIYWLLNDQLTLLKKNETDTQSIQPTDIGILVRTNREGLLIKKELAKVGIKSVTVDDTKVLETTEAPYILYLLDAILKPSRSSINKALLSPFTKQTLQDLLSQDEQQILTQFNDYLQIWMRDGILPVLNRFAADFDIRKILLHDHPALGDRLLSNYQQITELLHTVEVDKAFSPAELVKWLARAIESKNAIGDQFEQRIESDENAVQIMTVHKSKGLQFPIVFLPYLDLKNTLETNKGSNTILESKLVAYKDESSNFRASFYQGLTPEEQLQLQLQLEQENRRLLYVAMTRPVYKCYLFHSTSAKTSTLVPFIDLVKESNPDYIQFQSVEELHSNLTNAPIANNAQLKGDSHSTQNWMTPLQPKRFWVTGMHWKKVSYTYLAGVHQSLAKPAPKNLNSSYDQFIFHQLDKGARIGNLIHTLLELIDFQQPSDWAFIINKQLKKQYPSKLDTYGPGLVQLFEHVLNCQLNSNASEPAPHSPIASHSLISQSSTIPPSSSIFPFSLSNIHSSQLLQEFEFDKMLPLFKAKTLETLSSAECEIHIGSDEQLEGILNGKVDLFFEHQGQYFIVDWKTNYLGDQFINYESAQLLQAMNDNNYHLQYLIYTLAVTLYLKQRLPRFDYETQFGGVYYLFVRGMRQDQNTGVFYRKPTWSTVKALADLLKINL